MNYSLFCIFIFLILKKNEANIYLKAFIISKAAILQSGYIPWKGYFDIINSVDEFILLDDVQYTRQDWRNRNVVKTPAGIKWMTIPVKQEGVLNLKIREIRVSDPGWCIEHWNKLVQYYSKAPFFDLFADRFSSLYLDNKEIYLSKINCKFIKEVNEILGITTKISWSTDYKVDGDPNVKLINLCKACGADRYLSGPSASAYLDESLFDKEGIQVEWMDYTGYPEYHQLYPPFVHGVSILDLLFNEGPRTPLYMKSFKKL